MYIGLFDLDGTISYRDTLVPYVLGFCARHPWRLFGLLRMPWPVVKFLIDKDRGALKEALVKATLRGVSRSEIAAWNARWVPRLLRGGVHRAALKRIEEHREHGDYLVLMSASVDLYVPAIARALRMNEAICTGLRWDGMTLSGDLTTPNRRGEEKVRCLQMLRERFPGSQIAAYGNSHSDLPHMRVADRAFLVNASAKTVRDAAQSNIEVGWGS